MKDEEKLKPCPFCGCAAGFMEEYKYSAIGCLNCKVHFMFREYGGSNDNPIHSLGGYTYTMPNIHLLGKEIT